MRIKILTSSFLPSQQSTTAFDGYKEPGATVPKLHVSTDQSLWVVALFHLFSLQPKKAKTEASTAPSFSWRCSLPKSRVLLLVPHDFGANPCPFGGGGALAKKNEIHKKKKTNQTHVWKDNQSARLGRAGEGEEGGREETMRTVRGCRVVGGRCLGRGKR